MKKVWEWLKTNWKYLIFPVWVASLVLVWIFHGGTKQFLPISGTTDAAADEAMRAKEEAVKQFRTRLDEIHARAAERLMKASAAQIKEFGAVKNKSLEEVAAWIDSLS